VCKQEIPWEKNYLVQNYAQMTAYVLLLLGQTEMCDIMALQLLLFGGMRVACALDGEFSPDDCARVFKETGTVGIPHKFEEKGKQYGLSVFTDANYECRQECSRGSAGSRAP
jgi:hypothetical protein